MQIIHLDFIILKVCVYLIYICLIIIILYQFLSMNIYIYFRANKYKNLKTTHISKYISDYKISKMIQ